MQQPMHMEVPDLPPLFSARLATAEGDVARQAAEGAANGALGAGDILWREEDEWLRLALVVEPDAPLAEGGAALLRQWLEAIRLALVRLLPPLVTVETAGRDLLLNGARAGAVRLLLPAAADEAAEERAADWAVLALDLRLRLPAGEEPGAHPERTAVAEEGGAQLAAPQIVAECARYFLLGLDETTSA
jgi:hypothetical protein